MENEEKKVDLNDEQLEAVTGGVGDCAQWKIIGYCPSCKDRVCQWKVIGYCSNCREHTWFKCSMYPGEGPFYCTCGTLLTDVRVEEV